MLEQVEGPPVDPYADCRRAIESLERLCAMSDLWPLWRANQRTPEDIVASWRKSIMLADAIARTLRFPDESLRKLHLAALAEADVPSLRLYIAERLGGT